MFLTGSGKLERWYKVCKAEDTLQVVLVQFSETRHTHTFVFFHVLFSRFVSLFSSFSFEWVTILVTNTGYGN